MACIFVTTCCEKFTICDQEKKTLIFFLTCYMMMWHVNPCHITLGPHNIHVNFFNYKLPSATYHYLKQLKNISPNMC
jgi:hypothetical protein